MKFGRTELVTLFILIVLLIGLGTYVISTYLLNDPVDTSSAATSLSRTATSSYTAISGQPVDLRTFDSKIRVVNSWASWSPYSATELPALNQLALDFKDKNVVVVAINHREPASIAEQYLATLAALDALVVVLDPTDEFYHSVGAFAMPETIVYGAAGNVIMHHHGALNIQELRQRIETIATVSESSR